MVVYRFIPPTVGEFTHVFQTAGGSLSDIIVFHPPPRTARGGGLLSLLKGIGRIASPFLVKYIKPEAAAFGKRILGDVLQGKSVKQSLKQRGLESVRNVGERFVRGGRVRKRCRKKATCPNISQYHSSESDIFNGI